jgi:hypothetical protein
VAVLNHIDAISLPVLVTGLGFHHVLIELKITRCEQRNRCQNRKFLNCASHIKFLLLQDEASGSRKTGFSVPVERCRWLAWRLGDVITAEEETFQILWRHVIVGGQGQARRRGSDNIWGNDDHQFALLTPKRVGPEECAKDWNFLDPWNIG